MTSTGGTGVAIAELVFYTPALFIGLWLAIRHGFWRSSGWINLVLFSGLRIAGAALQLSSASRPSSTAVLQAIGLSPLMMTLLGILDGVLDVTVRAAGGAAASPSSSLTRLVGSKNNIRIVHIVVVVGLILGAVGGNQAADAAAKGENGGHYVPGGLSKAGSALMIVGYAALAGLTAACCAAVGLGTRTPVWSREGRLLLAVALSLAPLLVRLVYAAASTFGNGRGVFSVVSGSTAVLVGMAIVMEMLVVAIVEAVGLTVGRVQKDGASAAGSTSMPVVEGGWTPVDSGSGGGGGGGSGAREPLRQNDTYNNGYGYGDEGYAMEEAGDHDRHRRHYRHQRRGLGRLGFR